MKNTTTLFVAFSHNLTPSQIEGFKMQYGTFVPAEYMLEGNGGIEVEGGMEMTCPAYYDANIVTLNEVEPELQQKMKNIPANATLVEIQELAKAIVAEAVKAGASHFFCTGEPTLTLWANLYAGNHCFLKYRKDIEDYLPFGKELKCIQSTTERTSVEEVQKDGSVVKRSIFNHIQWREMF